MEHMSPEFQDLKKKEFLDEKRRQRLRENNQDLREIEKQLRTAYFIKSLKDQQDQLAAKKHERAKQKEQERLEIEAQIKLNEVLLKEREKQEQQKKDTLCEMLRTQMHESVQRRQEAVADMTRERDNLERLMHHFKLEEEKEKKELEIRKKNMHQDLEDFMKQQDLRTRQELEIDEQIRLKALEIQRQRDEEKRKLQEIKRKDHNQQAAISEKIGLDLHKAELEKLKREKIMLELLEDDRLAKEDQRFRQDLERQVRARERVRFELETYIQKRKVERELEKRNKVTMERAEIERMILESEKETAIEIQRLREKEQAYNKAIQQMLEERRQERLSSAAAHLRDYEMSRAEDHKVQQAVEEERIRLLQEHSSEVLQYLPAGVLRESDREFLALPPRNSGK